MVDGPNTCDSDALSSAIGEVNEGEAPHKQSALFSITI